MAKYDVYLSYRLRDGMFIAKRLYSLLAKEGISVFFYQTSVPPGRFVSQQFLYDAISMSGCFVPIITDEYGLSEESMAMNELLYAIQWSENRSKTIIPIIATTNKDYPSAKLRFLLSSRQCFFWDGMDSLPEIARRISDYLTKKTEGEALYEKVSEYSKIGNHNAKAKTICQIIDNLYNQLDTAIQSERPRSVCLELLRLLESLSEYQGGFDEESKNTARIIIKTLDRMRVFLTDRSDKVLGNSNDLFLCAFAIRALYLDREIRSECASILTNGDAVIPCPIQGYIERQKPYVDAFNALAGLETENGKYTDEELSVISGTESFIFDGTNNSVKIIRPVKQRNEGVSELSEDDEILLSIAHFMQEGNKLFDVLQKKKMEGSFLKCLLTSYERLKNYCEVVGASDVAAQCVDRIVEIRNAVEKQNEDKETQDGKAEKGIKSLLGFTLHDSGSYDVFISFKSEDSDLAEKIYKYCQKRLKEVFWSKRSLPELSKSEYEDAIYDALRKSKHFIVVLSKLEYLRANWVKKEMQVFDRAITEGRKNNANFIFVVTDDVFAEIVRTNKMCLDERYCGYQIIKMSEFESVLYKYL